MRLAIVWTRSPNVCRLADRTAFAYDVSGNRAILRQTQVTGEFMMSRGKIKSVIAVSAVLLLAGCFELTDPEQRRLLKRGAPFKDLDRVRLVNATGELSDSIKKEMKCPGLIRNRGEKGYQIVSCKGKSETYHFYHSDNYPNIYLSKHNKSSNLVKFH